MGSFVFQSTNIEGLCLIAPMFHCDQRGYFSKPFERDAFAAHGISLDVVEELETCSARGTLRGLHFQRRHSQNKLVRVLSGEVCDVAVDLRPGSGTFGTWQGFTLSAKNREMLYLPKGFAHGFLAREDNTVVHYLCGDRYDPESEDGILWNDRDLDIRWPLGPEETPLLSGRDQGFQTFQQFKQSLSREMGGNEIG
ncbi:MAG: dTDP-4-dehydrorhamnose 3,5-epimerase [Oscillospiraceae bacterium]